MKRTLGSGIKQMIKLPAIYLTRLFMHVLYLFFPVKQGRVLFNSYRGYQYSCNPMYISQYLQKNYPQEFEIVWMFNDPSPYEGLRKRGIRTVKYNLFNRLYYGMTSQIRISNTSIPSWIPLRKEQLNICTWHGGGCYKKIRLEDKRRNWAERKMYKLSAQDTSYMLSTSQYFTEHVISEDFNYHGKILNIGFPRNDIFFHGNRSKIREKVCKYFHIDANHDLVLYAPTWRRFETDGKIQTLDFQAVKQAYKNRFGKECVILFRAHHFTNFPIYTNDIIDATKYPYMQELLMACDLLISDYSSCIWDYSLTGRPCLLFTPDLEAYIKDQGFKKDIHQWGFPVCETNEQLCDTIKNLDLEQIRRSMKNHQEDLGSYEHGDATRKVGTLIHDFYTGVLKDE